MSRTSFVAICFSLYLCGCPAQPNVVVETTNSGAIADLKVNGPLRVLVLDDQPLATILDREWRALSEHPLQVTNATETSLLGDLDNGIRKLETDVVIFSSAMLGELVEKKLLRPIPSELMNEPAYRKTDIYGLVRLRETQWNRQTYAVSFGSPTLVLMRRTDLVPQAPDTWKELNEQLIALSDTLPEGLAPIAQPFANGWGARMLLVRAAAYFFDSSRVSSFFEYATMEPTIASPPFVRALNELTESFTGQSRKDLTPATALREFLEGKVAMAITWPSAISDEIANAIEFPISVSDLPGAAEHFQRTEETWVESDQGESTRATLLGVDGRLGAVSRGAKNAALANVFLAWASGIEQTAKLASRSNHTAPSRKSHEATAHAWVHPQLPSDFATRYVQVVQNSLSRSAAVHLLRLPGQHKYLNVLADVTNDVVLGQKDAADSLKKAVVRWKSITEQLDLKTQQAAYRRSLGIDVN